MKFFTNQLQKLIIVPCDIENGPIVLEEQFINNKTLIGGLYEASSWQIRALVENKNLYDITIQIKQPIKVERAEILELNNIEESNKINDITNEIRT